MAGPALPPFSPTLMSWQRQTAAVYGFASRAGRRMKIGLAEVAALEHLQTEGPLTPGQLGERLAMPSASVTALIDRLEAKRFVERKRNPDDRRGYFVVLSPASGDRAALDMLPMALQIDAIAAGMPEADQAAVTRFLDAVSSALSAGAVPPGRARPAQRRLRPVSEV